MATRRESLPGTVYETLCVGIDDPSLAAALAMHARASGISAEQMIAEIVEQRLREQADQALDERMGLGPMGHGSGLKH